MDNIVQKDIEHKEDRRSLNTLHPSLMGSFFNFFIKMSYLVKIILDFWSKKLLHPYFKLHKKDSSIENDGGPITSLGDDIVVDILSRLPAESVLACVSLNPRWVRLISSDHFVKMQLNSATTVTVAVFSSMYWLENRGSRSLIFFIEHQNRNPIMKEVGKNQFVEGSQSHGNTIELIGSCNGLLLLRYSHTFVVMVYNPVLQEVVTLKYPKPLGGRPSCFFFDELANEYKTILHYFEDKEVQYYLYGLKTVSPKELGVFKWGPPSTYHTSVNLPNAVCWIVYDVVKVGYPRLFKCSLSRCSQAIMVFQFDSGRLFVIPHPGNTCNSSKWPSIPKDSNVRLLVVDDRLAFSAISENVLNIWILEDMVNLSWVRRHSIDLAVMWERHIDIKFINVNSSVTVLSIMGSKLLLRWPDHLIWHDISSENAQRLDDQFIRELIILPCISLTCLRSFVSPKLVIAA